MGLYEFFFKIAIVLSLFFSGSAWAQNSPEDIPLSGDEDPCSYGITCQEIAEANSLSETTHLTF